MKIIYLHQHFNTPRSAGGSFSYEWARRFVANGHEVHVVTAERSPQRGRWARGWDETEEAGIRVHRYPVPYSNEMGYTRRIVSFLRFARAAARKAATLPGDVVIATSTPLTIALPGVYAARKQSIPMVFEIADLWPELPIAIGALRSPWSIAAARWLERYAYRHSAHVVAQSPGVKAGVIAAGYPAEQITEVPCGCDREQFDVSPEVGREFRARYDWLQDRPLIVYTGTMGPINGVDYLARVAAVAMRLDPEVRFLLVGGGREQKKVRREAERLGVLDKNLFMLPPVPKCEMPAVLSAADLATSVFIDLKEMWANNATKVFDAMAAGRPIAVNHQGWLAEMFQHSGCGLVMDVNDPNSAAGQLVAAVRDRPWLARAGAAAARLGRERFDRDLLAHRMESILLKLVPASRGACPRARKRRDKPGGSHVSAGTSPAARIVG
ncbi:MAG: glycosyltransferase family 4 protein [Candidatus Nealsonbacteria bacterium]|nr:glycosyltransferase family 4 protein [Candidatus Nealsonbacteria bacterium]